MAASMETLGIGGHEHFAEKIFEKVAGLPKLQTVELTQSEYDQLTPEQKSDPNKLYMVEGSGNYLKFQEISAEDYENLTNEQKMDPYTVYMVPGDGTYFRVIDISQEDYDDLPPEEQANPNNLYLIDDGVTDNHTAVVTAERLTGGSDDSILVTSMAYNDMKDLFEQGYDILIKYTYEEYAMDALQRSKVQYFRLKYYEFLSSTLPSIDVDQSYLYFTSNNTGYEYRIGAAYNADSNRLVEVAI